MKKLLSILGAIGLTTTSTTTLISCEKPNNNENGGGGNKPEPPYNPQQPPKNSSWKIIYSNDDVFTKIDNKYYFVIWRANENNDWRIIKFQNNKNIRLAGGFKFVLDYYGRVDDPNKINLVFDAKLNNLRANDQIWTDNSINFNSVYRWDGNNEPNIPEINKNTGEITNWKG